MDNKINEIAMQIILHAGNAKFNYSEALQFVKDGNREEAQKLIDEAEEELVQAHKAQMDLLQSEACGEKPELNILLVHAQDHLTMATLSQDFLFQLMEVYDTIDALKAAK